MTCMIFAPVISGEAAVVALVPEAVAAAKDDASASPFSAVRYVSARDIA